MKGRVLAAGVILLLWAGGLGLLVRREYFRPNVERFAEAAMRVAPGAVYYAVEQGGLNVGFASSTIDTARSSLAVVDYLVADVPSGGVPHRLTVRSRVQMSRALRVRSFEVRVDGAKGSVGARGRVLGDTLLEVAVTNGKLPVDTQRVPLHGPVLMPAMVPLAIGLGEKPKVGRRYLLPVFDPASLSAKDVGFAVTAESLFVVNDSSVFDSTSGRWRGVQPDTLHAWQVTADDDVFSGWIDEDGRVIQTTQLGLQLRRRPYEVAFENWRLSGGGTGDGGGAPRDSAFRSPQSAIHQRASRLPPPLRSSRVPRPSPPVTSGS